VAASLHHRRLLVAAVASLVVWFSACSRDDRPSFLATDITGSNFGHDFSLKGHDGRTYSLADFRGKVVAIFFGYTHCPDVCPTTLLELTGALKQLGPDGARVQILFVTVDPERDTPEVLKGYVTAFNGAFIGLRGSPEALAATAKEFKVSYTKRAGPSPQAYTMDHSAGTYLYDPAGRLRLYVSYGRGAQVYAHDIALLLKQ
jgi:protein SCO1/2